MPWKLRYGGVAVGAAAWTAAAADGVELWGENNVQSGQRMVVNQRGENIVSNQSGENSVQSGERTVTNEQAAPQMCVDMSDGSKVLHS